MPKNEEAVRAFLRAVAAKQRLILNPDEQLVADIARGLLSNYESMGYYCCPCRESWGLREKDRDIICPCDYCKKDVEEFNQCYCGLFVSSGAAADQREAHSIPDRRNEERYP